MMLSLSHSFASKLIDMCGDNLAILPSSCDQTGREGLRFPTVWWPGAGQLRHHFFH